jgi:hypothetical protein
MAKDNPILYIIFRTLDKTFSTNLLDHVLSSFSSSSWIIPAKIAFRSSSVTSMPERPSDGLLLLGITTLPDDPENLMDCTFLVEGCFAEGIRRLSVDMVFVSAWILDILRSGQSGSPSTTTLVVTRTDVLRNTVQSSIYSTPRGALLMRVSPVGVQYCLLSVLLFNPVGRERSLDVVQLAVAHY